jgi:hypothetical protein
MSMPPIESEGGAKTERCPTRQSRMASERGSRDGCGVGAGRVPEVQVGDHVLLQGEAIDPVCCVHFL